MKKTDYEPFNFKTSKKDANLIAKIIVRAWEIPEYSGVNLLGLYTSIAACHTNGCELDLERFLKADDFRFSYDVFGIARHVDRKTGKLDQHFMPRCARKGK